MRRIALSFRHRQRLLMQFDPSQHIPVSLPQNPSLKRAYSPDNASLSSPQIPSSSGPPTKLPKGNPSNTQMRSASSSARQSPAYRNSRLHRTGGPSYRKPKEDRLASLYALPQPDDPIHDLAYLQREYDTTSLKEAWKLNPKSPISNYCNDIGVRAPKYETKEVLIDGKLGFRYVFHSDNEYSS